MLLPGTRGEAAVVDLRSRGILFALLNNDAVRPASAAGGAIAWVAFQNLDRQARVDANGDSTKSLAYFIDAMNRGKPKADVSIEALPLLVRFRDPNDPRTVERVDPNHLAQSLGPGATLARATVEITDDPLTTGIEKELPWLAGGELGTLLKKRVGPPRPAGDASQIDDLRHGDFRRFTQ